MTIGSDAVAHERPEGKQSTLAGRQRALQAVMGILTFGAACSPFGAYSVLLGAVTAIGLALTISSPRPFKVFPAWIIPILTFASWTMLSASWSALPSTTVRYSLLYSGLTLLSLLAVQALSVVDFLKPVLYGLRAFFFASLLIAVALPGVGRVAAGYEGGAIQGLAVSRNTFGWLSVFYLITAVCLFLLARKTVSLTLDCLVAVGCLWAAQAQTSLLAALAVVTLLFVLWFMSFYGTFARASLLAVAIPTLVYLCFEVSASLDSVAESVGRDATFTGRTEIWNAVSDEIARNPYYGYGWFGVWWDGLPITYRMWNSAGFAMYHAHNSYLDLRLQIGWLGFSAVGLLLAVGAVGLLFSVVRGVPIGLSGWPALIFLSLAVTSFGESIIIELNGWLFFSLAYAGSAAAIRESRRLGEPRTS